MRSVLARSQQLSARARTQLMRSAVQREVDIGVRKGNLELDHLRVPLDVQHLMRPAGVAFSAAFLLITSS